jgi:hypothetical protein
MSIITFISNIKLKFWELDRNQSINNKSISNTCQILNDYEPDLEAGEGYYYYKKQENFVSLLPSSYDLEKGYKSIINETNCGN